MTIDVLKLRGSRYEMGVQQGRLYRMIVGQLNVFKVFREMKMVQAIKPVGGPPFNFVFKRLLNFGGHKIRKTIRDFYPHQYERLIGLAEGFNLSEKEMAASLYMENMSGDCSRDMAEPKKEYPPPGACTGGMVTNKNSSFLLKNYDFPSELENYQIIRYSDNTGEGYKTLALTEGPSLGLITGINEKGLALTLNAAYTDDLDMGMPPATITGQEVLESCDEVEEAVEMIQDAPVPIGWIFIMIDKHGKGRIVEKTPNSVGVREMNIGEDGAFLASGNTFNCKKTIEKQLAWGTKWSIDNYSDLMVLEPSKERGDQMESLLNRLIMQKKNQNQIKIKELHEILAAHNEKEPNGGPTTICNHHEYYKTLSGHIIDTKTKSFYIGDGNPCEVDEFLEYPFKFDYATPDMRFYARHLNEDQRKKML